MQLIIGNKNYSSWSMRAWLLMRFLDIPFEEICIDLYVPGARDKVKALGGETGMVPILKDGELAIWDTLAITEYLYEQFPHVWPEEKSARARARSICSELCTGMSALRNAMPVNLRHRQAAKQWPTDVMADISRICEIWRHSLQRSGGPWLCGDFSATDIFFAPVASRFQTYSVPLDEQSRLYQQRILAHPYVQEWIELSRLDKTVIEHFGP